jgi:hypothetical protein
MFQSLLLIILGIVVLRLFQARIPAPKRPPASDFHPEAGAGDPPAEAGSSELPAFSSGEIVDGEFEELPGPGPR